MKVTFGIFYIEPKEGNRLVSINMFCNEMEDAQKYVIERLERRLSNFQYVILPVYSQSI